MALILKYRSRNTVFVPEGNFVSETFRNKMQYTTFHVIEQLVLHRLYLSPSPLPLNCRKQKKNVNKVISFRESRQIVEKTVVVKIGTY